MTKITIGLYTFMHAGADSGTIRVMAAQTRMTKFFSHSAYTIYILIYNPIDIGRGFFFPDTVYMDYMMYRPIGFNFWGRNFPPTMFINISAK